MEGQMDVQEILAVLHKWGIHTLGQLAALDKEQLAARLGPEAIGMWKRANGKSQRLLKLVRPPEPLAETLAPLLAALGRERLRTPVLEETHRPDAFRMEPFAWAVASDSSAVASAKEDVPSRQNRKSGSDSHALRTAHSTAALRRFRPAVSASLLLDEDTLAHVRSAEISGKIIEQRGPYFLSGNWWDEKSWARAEWDVQLENGELVRVNKNDPPSQSYGVGGRTWNVDGIYD